LYFDKKTVVLPYAEGFNKLHYHDRYEIGICEEGEGLFLSEGIFSYVSKGDVIFIAPKHSHYSRSLNKEAPCVCRFAYLRDKTVEELFLFLNNGKDASALKAKEKAIPPIIHNSEHPKLVAMISDIIEACKKDTADTAALSVLRMALLLLEAPDEFGDAKKFASIEHISDGVVANIAEHISLHYNESETVRELAALCYLSESQLRRRFISVYGVPPIAYRNSLRCKIAAELLTRTRLPISEISERIGYTSTSDFYRAFKKMYNASPSTYRAQKNL
jgi:AraC-like DNA-binding protein